MNEQIIEMIEKEITDTLTKIKDMEPGSKERDDAMKYISELYSTLNSERKCLIESQKVDFDKIISIGKLGIDLFGVVGPLLLYNSWMKKGFEFEKTGMITSQTFKGLISKFKPTR